MQGQQQELQKVFRNYTQSNKQRLKEMVDEVRSGFLYGFGNAITSTSFGDACSHIWQSMQW
eukprot:CAMPEP_0119556922 /NCGR_PEP_ID=MMETSP1352-20130426/8733_1 /TAXON_ID=265584 /ORGANISM="Stauroneis constricta, Strain CCMP1120" /LENGTH=60 /DNA_ID=CAMNT_0007603937 /DNA_START=1 /DNA_END=180 /DNA_ORIENTATION=+